MLLDIRNGFLISTWKYWIWISKNETILRSTGWKGFWLLFYPKRCVTCYFVSVTKKYRLVYWTNVGEWPKYTLHSQQSWKLTNNGREWCNFKMHVTGCLSIIKHSLWRTSKEPFSSLLWFSVLCYCNLLWFSRKSSDLKLK